MEIGCNALGRLGCERKVLMTNDTVNARRHPPWKKMKEQSCQEKLLASLLLPLQDEWASLSLFYVDAFHRLSDKSLPRSPTSSQCRTQTQQRQDRSLILLFVSFPSVVVFANFPIPWKWQLVFHPLSLSPQFSFLRTLTQLTTGVSVPHHLL